VSELDTSGFTLDRFREGDRVFVWKRHQGPDGGAGTHGAWGFARTGLSTARKAAGGKWPQSPSHVELEDGSRVYGDSGAAFMTEGEFSVFEVMDS